MTVFDFIKRLFQPGDEGTLRNEPGTPAQPPALAPGAGTIEAAALPAGT